MRGLFGGGDTKGTDAIVSIRSRNREEGVITYMKSVGSSCIGERTVRNEGRYSKYGSW